MQNSQCGFISPPCVTWAKKPRIDIEKTPTYSYIPLPAIITRLDPLHCAQSTLPHCSHNTFPSPSLIFYTYPQNGQRRPRQLGGRGSFSADPTELEHSPAEQCSRGPEHFRPWSQHLHTRRHFHTRRSIFPARQLRPVRRRIRSAAIRR